ncbi:hypothetical protein AVEN_75303-1 [Araneus ventricosus]|uniref:Uncharacterized protein n=1 Tax=Araneus ventricosus TaxID=182803 RepID=A0A4Y2G4Z4_ARAVE|nr:hypothetical protein AVEN_75303-1 [Araneus ventricosus]
MVFSPRKYFALLCLLLMCHSWTADTGILKGRNKGNSDDGVETLLAVGLIAKALSDIEQPSSTQCPPPVTKVIHVPVHTEKIYVVKENEKGN